MATEGKLKCKVISSTKARDREEMGEVVTRFIAEQVNELVGKEVHQSSDNEYHCLTIVLWYK